MHAIAGNRALLGGVARSTWWPATAPPRHRYSCRPPPACATAAPSAADFAQRVGADSKVTKTAVRKMAVAELRAECERLGLPSEGLKGALVDRLMDWWQQEQEQPADSRQVQQEQQKGNAGQQPAAEQDLQPAAAWAAAPATAPSTVPAAQPMTAPPPSSNGTSSPSPRSSSSNGQLWQGQCNAGGKIQVTWLGTSSGNPTPRRNVSAIAVRFAKEIYLVDCGEGTRNQLRRAGMDPATLRTILVTHMHGDHCFGIGGVIQAMCEARLGGPQQRETLHIFGPPELQSQVLMAVRMGSIQLTTPLVVTGFVLDPARARPPTPADAAGMVWMALQAPDKADRLPPAMATARQAAYDQGSEQVVQHGLTWTVCVPGGPKVVAAQLQHRVPCWGYVFHEPQQAVRAPPQAREMRAMVADGQTPSRRRPAPQWVRPGRKLVILGDTCDSSAIAPLAIDCDLLSHEATFCSGMEDKAAIAQHSTTEQAGAFAAAVNARNLVLTHFSARYESLSALAQKLQRSSKVSRGNLKAEVMSRDLKRGEMQRLLDETRSTYGKDSIFLASDFYTFDVARPPPMPADQFEAQQEEQAMQAQAVERAAQAAAQVARGRREQRQHHQRAQQWQVRQGGWPQQGRGQRQYQQQRPRASGPA